MSDKLLIFSVAILLIILIYYLSFKKSKFIRVLGLLGAIYGIVYILWRLVYTLPSVGTLGFVFGVILVLFEVIALGQSLVFKMLFSSNKKLKLHKDQPFTELPSVDVIISTYNEPEEILKRTLVGCINIDYPKEKLNIYIGDDGKRDDIKALADSFGVHYVTRQNNDHAKAGNINNVLAQSFGEFFLVLDADMIPKDTIINEMIGYFEDSRTGFVQSPQVFYNLDPFQYNLNVGEIIPNEQDFFMRTIQGKRALYNAVLHVGTNAIFRREAILNIGGIPTGSITEDMATGMLLQNAGFQSYFVGETLAIGLSVEGIEDLIKQRDRWLRGNVQVIKKYNPIFMKGLNWTQKIIYLDGFFYWLYGVQKMVYILAPLLYLFFRVKILDSTAVNIAMMFFPYFISNSLFFRKISDKSRNMAWSHIYDTAIAPQMAISFLTEFFIGKDLKFNVTPKGVRTTKDNFRIRLANIHIILLVLSVIAVVWNGYLLVNGQTEGIVNALIINLFWCVYNAMAVFISIFIYIDKKRFRQSERMPTNFKAKGLIENCPNNKNCEFCGYILDLSETGARLQLKNNCPGFICKENEKIPLNIETIGEINCTIKWIERKEDQISVGLAFDPVNFEVFSKINQYRFSQSNKYIRDFSIDPKMDSLFEIIYKILTRWKYPKKKTEK
jgi:cellulose synthase (UDP-forming)